MAGSLTYRRYIADSLAAYSARVDKSNSNAEVTGASGGSLMPIRTVDYPAAPRGLSKRYVLCYNKANPSERRKFYVGSPSLVAAAVAPGATLTAEDYPGAGDTAGSNVTWVVTYYRGETLRLAPAFSSPDTGLTDGLATQ